MALNCVSRKASRQPQQGGWGWSEAVGKAYAGLVDLEVVFTELLLGFGLGHTDGTDGGVPNISLDQPRCEQGGKREHSREDNTRHVLIRQLIILILLPSIQPVRQPPPRRDRHRRQQHLPRHIPNNINILDITLLILIRDDIPLLVHLDIFKVFESELFGVGVTTDGPEEDVDFEGFAVVRVEEETGRGLFDFFYVGRLVDVDAGFLCRRE